MKSEMNELRLLSDSTVKAPEDEFNHDVYASLLGEILNPAVNDCGISVALFGKWGQGKSTIVGMLIDKFAAQVPHVLEPIWFNAWQARGDSVRRQLAIAILEVVNPKKANALKKHAGVNIPDVFDEKSGKETACIYAKTFLGVILSPAFWVCAVFSLVLIAIVLASFMFAFYSTTSREVWLAIASLLASGAAFAFFKTCDKISDVFDDCTDNYTISERHLLKYPEQFAEVVSRCTAVYSKANKGQELLIVVDDLDRCDPETVVEALATIKQLASIREYKKRKYPVRIRFLVPCDERQVVLALETDGHDAGDEGGRYHDYQSEELLRKFFDVIVRMDKLLPRDLTHYAEKLATSIGIQDLSLVRSLVHAVSPRDPRQVKKLINAYKTAKRRVELSREKGYLPSQDEELPGLDKTLIAIVALRETYPEIYEEIVSCAPENLAVIRNGKIDDILKLECVRCKKEEVAKRLKLSLTRAAAMLRVIPDVNISTAELIIHGQAEDGLRGVPLQGQIYRAVRALDSQLFVSALPNEEKHVKSVFSWLGEKVEFGRTVEEIRGVYGIVLDFYKMRSNGIGYVTKVLTHLLRNEQYRKEVLQGYDRLPEIADSCMGLSETQQEELWNLLEIHGTPDSETALFFRVGSRLPPKIKERFSSGLKKIVTAQLAEKLEKDVDISDLHSKDLIKMLFDLLPENRTFCYGLAPDIGTSILTAKWNPKEGAKKEFTPQTDIGLLLIGNDPASSLLALQELLEDGIWDADVDLEDSDAVRCAWRCIADLLGQIEQSNVPRFFVPVQNWLQKKCQPKDRKWLYEQVRPVVLAFSDEQLREFAVQLSNEFRSDLPWVVEYIGPKPTTNAEKWHILHREVFKTVSSLLKGDIDVATEVRTAFERMRHEQWSVDDLSDVFLAEKIGTITQGKRIDAWGKVLIPLLGSKKPSKVTEALLADLSRWLYGPLLIGLQTSWKSRISMTDAEVLARAIFNANPERRQFDNWSIFNDLANTRGSEYIFGKLVELLTEQDSAYHYKNSDLLMFVVKNLDKAENARKFEHLLEGMTHNSNAIIQKTGIILFSKCPSITADAKAYLKELWNVALVADVKDTLKACLEQHGIN